MVEFSNEKETEDAMKHMDGGQIDGQEVTVAPILSNARPRLPRRLSPPRRAWKGAQRFGRRSPFRRARRSRSPRPRRRNSRRSNSSDSC